MMRNFTLVMITSMAITLTGCGSTPAPDSACVAFAPIYLSEPAIQALQPFRAERAEIAAHNRTWEFLCTSA